MQKIKRFIFQPTFLLTIFVILAGALRALLAKTEGGFWFDEIFSVHFSAYPLRKMVGLLMYDNHPLLYPIILHYWLRLFGDQEIIVRSLTSLFTLISIITIYFLGKEFFNKKTGLIAAFFLAFSPTGIIFSAEARMYSLLMCLTILGLLIFWSFIKKPTVLKGILFLGVCILLLFTHLYALYVIFFFNLYYFYRYFFLKDKKIKLNIWLCLQFLLLIIFASWFIPFLLIKIQIFSTINNFYNSWFSRNLIINYFFINLFKSLLFISHFDFFFEPLVNLFIWSLLILAVVKINFYKKSLIITPALNQEKVFLLIFLILLAIATFICQKFLIKLYVIIIPAFYLLISSSLAKFSKKVTLVILIIISIIFINSYYYLYQESYDTIPVVNYLETVITGQEKVIVHNFVYKYVLEKYYHGPSQIEGFYPAKDNLNEDLRLILKNYQDIVNEENVNKLEQSVGGAKRIFLIKSLDWNKQSSELVLEWFSKNNYKIIEKKFFQDTEIYLFQKD